VPGVEPPTAQLETDAALAVLVFLSVIWFGVRSRGVKRLSEILRRAQSGDDPAQHARKRHPVVFDVRAPVRQRDERCFIIGIIASLAGLLVPIPLMALELLTGLVQAYIFAVLAMVFITAAVEGPRPPPEPARCRNGRLASGHQLLHQPKRIS
jgi:F-type H+-transporting ATPase subunit a